MTRKSEQGFTLIELLIVVAIISIIAAIAVPGLLSARMTGNETSAIQSLRTTHAAQLLYSTACGNGGYAASYVVLGTPPPGSAQAFISEDLGRTIAPIKTGFNLTMTPGAGSAAGPNDCNGAATVTTYIATAVPQTFGSSGTRSFAVNPSGSIWQVSLGTAPAEPFGPPAVTIQ